MKDETQNMQLLWSEPQINEIDIKVTEVVAPAKSGLHTDGYNSEMTS